MKKKIFATEDLKNLTDVRSYDGEWFCAGDICKAIGGGLKKNSPSMFQRLEDIKYELVLNKQASKNLKNSNGEFKHIKPLKRQIKDKRKRGNPETYYILDLALIYINWLNRISCIDVISTIQPRPTFLIGGR